MVGSNTVSFLGSIEPEEVRGTTVGVTQILDGTGTWVDYLIAPMLNGEVNATQWQKMCLEGLCRLPRRTWQVSTALVRLIPA